MGVRGHMLVLGAQTMALSQGPPGMLASFSGSHAYCRSGESLQMETRTAAIGETLPVPTVGVGKGIMVP